MIGRLAHVAVAVPDLAKAVALYRDALGATVSEPHPLPSHGVTACFVDLPGSRVELLEPLGDDSPIASFLARFPAGGLHHLCYEVEDLEAARARLAVYGLAVVGPYAARRIGAHGRPVLFVHPKDGLGTLIELEEAPRA